MISDNKNKNEWNEMKWKWETDHEQHLSNIWSPDSKKLSNI